jgi:hypothetical protein
MITSFVYGQVHLFCLNVNMEYPPKRFMQLKQKTKYKQNNKQIENK